jgi:hypothetical protein
MARLPGRLQPPRRRMLHELGDLSNGVAIVSSYPFDFEGSARRFVVVPLGQPGD